MFANTKKSFTLAEIILVMTIIGSIASFTIPAFVENVQDRILQTAWKSAYSDLSQATNRIMLDNGGTLVGAFQEDDNSARDKYAQYLSYAKSCDDSIGNCWSDTFYRLNGQSENYFWVWSNTCTGTSGGVKPGLVLNNGMFIVFNTMDGSSTCSRFSEGVCGSIYVDVNGFKGPNTIGKDIFYTAITKNGLKPVAGRTCIKPPATGWDAYTNFGYICSSYYLRQ